MSSEAVRQPQSTIAVGVDGSAQAQAAVAWAVHEARVTGDALLLLHAIDYPVQPIPHFDVRPDETGGHELLARAEQQILAAEPDLQVTGVVDGGRASEVLRIGAADARLLVVGRRGLGGFSRLLAGSTSVAVAGRSRSPVVIVPSGWDQLEHVRQPVVVGVALDHDPTEALGFAFEYADQHSTPLVALHAWSLGHQVDVKGLEGGRVDQFGYWLSRAESDTEEALRPLRKLHPDTTVEVENHHGHAARALIGATYRAQMLVVGRSGEGPLGGFPIGSVARAVLHHAECPVTVVPT
jgi:nucleotide-binding universal stress UspA family protein